MTDERQAEAGTDERQADARADGQPAPALGPSVDATIGDETRELLLRGEIDEALHRHDGTAPPRPEEDPERTTGELGGAGGEQAGGAG